MKGRNAEDQRYLDTVSSRVARMRRDRGWSLRDLARRAGVGPSTIHRLEHAKDVTLTQAARIVKALGGNIYP